MGGRCFLPWFVAVGYDAVGLIRKTVVSSGITGEELKTALYAIKGYKGASSEISINDVGSSPQYEYMYQIKHGKFVLVESVS